MISSPYDTEARYSSKRSVDFGYKVHLTETCDPDAPHLIVHVETTPAAVSDEGMVPIVHAALARAGRLPSEHLVDAGYADVPVLLKSQQLYGVTLIGQWQMIRVGKPALGKASPKPISRWIGIDELSLAQLVSRVFPGCRTPIPRPA
jgi:hypothetical protein